MCISFSLLTTICTGCGLSTLNKDYDDDDGDNKDYGWMDGWKTNNAKITHIVGRIGSGVGLRVSASFISDTRSSAIAERPCDASYC